MIIKEIPVYFQYVKRSALLVKAKKPFYDWLLSIDPKEDQTYMLKEGDLYLLTDYDEVKQMNSWLKKNFDDIFSDQLNNWYIDDDMWPQNRTLKMFKEWFEYTMHTTVLDTEEEFIEKV